MAMNFKNQYNGMLTLRGVTEGANLSIRNSWRLFRSAEVLFTEKDYASAVALAVLALEENGKYLTLIPILERVELEKKWKAVRTHTCKTKELNAYLALLKLLPEERLSKEEVAGDIDRTFDVQKMIDVLKQKGFYVDCVGAGRWQYPPETFSDFFSFVILLMVRSVMREPLFTEEEIQQWRERVVKEDGSIDDDALKFEMTKDVALNTLLNGESTVRLLQELKLGQEDLLKMISKGGVKCNYAPCLQCGVEVANTVRNREMKGGGR